MQAGHLLLSRLRVGWDRSGLFPGVARSGDCQILPNSTAFARRKRRSGEQAFQGLPEDIQGTSSVRLGTAVDLVVQ